MTTIDDQIQIYIQANWEPFVKQLSIAFNRFSEMFQKWSPVISQAHRAEVKRVHTSYDRKRRARRRRN